MNADQDSIEQITQILANYSKVETLHIISHGAPGCLFLGNTQLNLDTLASYTNFLQSWSASEILLYGCNVAAGDAGEEFINKLHNITQASVAASRTRTGNATQGGNWELEITRGRGKFAVAVLPEVMATYPGVMSNEAPTFSHIYDFENGLEGWTDGTDDDFDWTLNSGGTRSRNTGPSVDRTLGTASGTYLYTEASDTFNQQADLISPTLDFSSRAANLK